MSITPLTFPLTTKCRIEPMQSKHIKETHFTTGNNLINFRSDTYLIKEDTRTFIRNISIKNKAEIKEKLKNLRNNDRLSFKRYLEKIVLPRKS